MTGGLAVYLGQSLQIVLGAVFLVAAAAKLKKPSLFVAALRGYELVPPVLSGPLAAGLVLIELLVAVSLLSGWAVGVAVPVAGALLLGFAVAVGINLRRGRMVSCGCFGSVSERISPRTLARLGVLMVATIGLAVVRVVARPAPLNVANVAADGMAGVERLVLILAFGAFLTVVATWLLHIPEISVLFRRPSRGA